MRRCCVCQLEFEGEDSAMTLPCCHYYHTECIKQWLGINKASHSLPHTTGQKRDLRRVLRSPCMCLE